MSDHHGPNVLRALEEVEERKKKLLDLGQQMMSAYSANLYPVDLLAIGAIKRSISMSAGLRLLVGSFNMTCASSLLRLHIDTALRFFAVFLVEQPHEFATSVLGGEQISRMKDSFGNRMTDSFLVSKLAPEYPWLPTVYKNLSGYVHFSDQHLFDPVYETDDITRTVTYVIHERDTKYPEFSWLEVVGCFNESTDIFMKYLEGWIFTKSHPEMVAKLRQELERRG